MEVWKLESVHFRGWKVENGNGKCEVAWHLSAMVAVLTTLELEYFVRGYHD